jgi:hypothetical protein
MMRSWFVAWMLLLVNFTVDAQEQWYKGTVHLKNNQVLKGQVAFKPEYEVIFFRVGDGEELTVIPAFRVFMLSVFDTLDKIDRRFVSLRIGDGPKSLYQFFELVVDGTVPVFRRQQMIWYSIYLDEVDFDYYILYNDELYLYQKFKKHIYPSLARDNESLVSYVEQNRLNLGRLGDVLQTIRFYNGDVVSSPLASTADR